MGKTVLILDDEKDLLDVMKGLLETIEDIRSVVVASKFSEAYSKIKNQKFQ